MMEPSRLDPRFVNPHAVLPYGLKTKEIEVAVAETYRLFHGLNSYLRTSGFPRLEALILGNSLSGMVSEFLCENLARASSSLEANLKVGGHPDLLPKGKYASNQVLKGKEGIEVKASVRPGGWQGHNPEDGWLLVFRFHCGAGAGPTPAPLTFVEILCAKVAKSDWSFSGRKGTSRRTPTASLTAFGVEKLRRNFVYRIPGVGVGTHREVLASR
ncbi:MAG: hypothetical protein FJ109_22140 [Deltaproteobacteria bacterium]|nr:hypothetical protein [Deltaproteobacteria bacterium]